MDIKQLRYFRAIVQEGNITGAAKRMFMTQPSLSQQLQLLEDELGVKLIDRGSRKITLTDAGRLLYVRAEQMLDLLNSTATELKEIHGGYKGNLSIGTIASSGVTLLPGLIREFHLQYPNVKIDFRESDTPGILALLSNGVIEVGIIRSIFDLDSYYWIDLPTEPMIIANSELWANGEEAQSITIKELKDKPILIHRNKEAMIYERCRQYGFEPNIVCKGDDVRSLLVLANEGIGFAIVPKSSLGLMPSSTIQYREIADSQLEIKKAVVWLKHRYISVAAKKFITMLAGDVSQSPDHGN